MLNLLLVTHVDFWRQGAGHRTRISMLLEYLQDKANVTLVYVGFFDDQDDFILRTLYPGIGVVVLDKRKGISYGEYHKTFEAYAKGKTFDVALVEYIEMSFVLPYINPECVTLLDTHDLVFDRIASFQRQLIPYEGINLTLQEEIDIFQCFDYVIVIQPGDYEKVSQYLDRGRILLSPHAVSFTKQSLQHSVRNIGYVASGYAPNIDALSWFLENIWTGLSERHDIVLNVYGPVCSVFENTLKFRPPNVIVHGFVTDLNVVYDSCDIIINPVRFGAGLKVKNVEALGNGLPLVTTTHGAMGMEDGTNSAFLVGDSPTDFQACIERLIGDYQFRLRLGDAAYQFARDHYSPEECYGSLLRIVTSCAD